MWGKKKFRDELCAEILSFLRDADQSDFVLEAGALMYADQGKFACAFRSVYLHALEPYEVGSFHFFASKSTIKKKQRRVCLRDVYIAISILYKCYKEYSSTGRNK